MNFNMQQAMKQVQKMQAEMARVQQELEEKTVEVSVGGRGRCFSHLRAVGGKVRADRAGSGGGSGDAPGFGIGCGE